MKVLSVKKLKIAIIHDYLFQFGGAEKVVEKLLQIFPQSDVYTAFFIPEKFKDSESITKTYLDNKITTSLAQILFSKFKLMKFQKHFFWLYPILMSFITVKNYDLVIYSSTFCGKNVRFKNCDKVIHYCHSPTRFLHNLTSKEDQKSISGIYRLIIPILVWYLRILDLKAANYLTKNGAIWLANSKFVQENIAKIYNVKSEVLHPPIEIEDFLTITRKVDSSEPFYYYFGRISFHKRVDLIIKTCVQLRRNLKISGVAGSDFEMKKLKDLVESLPDGGKYVEFLGRSSDVQRNELLASCQAFLYPPKEDFGIAPVEALASGCPVIAFGVGGALEYVVPNTNGLLFENQSVESLKKAILEFESKPSNFWETDKIKQSVSKFGSQEFETRVLELATVTK